MWVWSTNSFFPSGKRVVVGFARPTTQCGGVYGAKPQHQLEDGVQGARPMQSHSCYLLGTGLGRTGELV